MDKFDPNSLKLLQKKLPHYFSYFKDEDTSSILCISEDKASLPFALAIIEYDTHPDYFVLSFAINNAIAQNVADVTLEASKIAHVALGEGFYISTSGDTFFGDEASDRHDLDSIDLNEIEPMNDLVN